MPFICRRIFNSFRWHAWNPDTAHSIDLTTACGIAPPSVSSAASGSLDGRRIVNTFSFEMTIQRSIQPVAVGIFEIVFHVERMLACEQLPHFTRVEVLANEALLNTVVVHVLPRRYPIYGTAQPSFRSVLSAFFNVRLPNFVSSAFPSLQPLAHVAVDLNSLSADTAAFSRIADRHGVGSHDGSHPVPGTVMHGGKSSWAPVQTPLLPVIAGAPSVTVTSTRCHRLSKPVISPVLVLQLPILAFQTLSQWKHDSRYRYSNENAHHIGSHNLRQSWSFSIFLVRTSYIKKCDGIIFCYLSFLLLEAVFCLLRR